MTARKLKMISTLPCLILHGAVRHPLRGEGDLPKGDITPYAYLVKWVTRRRGVQKPQKRGDVLCVRPIRKKYFVAYTLAA